MKDFEKWNKQFDKNFERMQKVIIAGWIAGLFVTLSALAGIAFVIYKVLIHFGIL